MGLLNLDNLSENALLQAGLGILSNNQGHGGQFMPAFSQGSLQGLQQANEFKRKRQEELLRQQQMEMQKAQFEWQKQAQQRALDEKARRDAALPRLLGGDASYQSMQNTPVTSTQNVPIPAQEGAQAPNFGTTAQSITTMQQTPYIDNAKRMQDYVDAGLGDEIIKAQLSPKEHNFDIAPDGTMYDKKSGKILPGNKFAKPASVDAPSNVREYEYAKGQGYRGSFLDFQIAQKKAGASNQSVVVGTDKKYGEILGGKLAEQDAASIDAARSAPDRLRNARNIKNILVKNPITGTGAEWRLGLNKALATAGLIDGDQVKNTEDLVSVLASGTLDAIKTSGLGSGQGFTDKDRAFLEKARSGNIEINAGTLKTLADINERAAIASIKRGNDVVKAIKSDPNSGTIGSRLDEIQIPEDVGAVVKTVTLKDIQDTAKASGKTTKQVTEDLKKRGYVIGK